MGAPGVGVGQGLRSDFLPGNLESSSSLVLPLAVGIQQPVTMCYGLNFCAPKSYTEVLAPSACERDLIWDQRICRCEHATGRPLGGAPYPGPGACGLSHCSRV